MRSSLPPRAHGPTVRWTGVGKIANAQGLPPCTLIEMLTCSMCLPRTAPSSPSRPCTIGDLDGRECRPDAACVGYAESPHQVGSPASSAPKRLRELGPAEWDRDIVWCAKAHQQARLGREDDTLIKLHFEQVWQPRSPCDCREAAATFQHGV